MEHKYFKNTLAILSFLSLLFFTSCNENKDDKPSKLSEPKIDQYQSEDAEFVSQSLKSGKLKELKDEAEKLVQKFDENAKDKNSLAVNFLQKLKVVLGLFGNRTTGRIFLKNKKRSQVEQYTRDLILPIFEISIQPLKLIKAIPHELALPHKYIDPNSVDPRNVPPIEEFINSIDSTKSAEQMKEVFLKKFSTYWYRKELYPPVPTI